MAATRRGPTVGSVRTDGRRGLRRRRRGATHERLVPTRRRRNPGPLDLGDGQHRPPEAERHHLRQHLGLVRLGDDGDGSAGLAQRVDHERARLRADRVRDPWAPRARLGRRAVRRPRGLRRAAAWRVTPSGNTAGATHTTTSRWPAASSRSNSPDGLTWRRRSTSGRSVRKRGQAGGAVDRGGGVDHADPHRPGRARAASLGPAGQVLGAGQHGLRVVEHDRRGFGRHAPPAVALRTARRPSRRSSSDRPWLSAEGVTPTAAAASAHVGASCTATRYSSCWTERFGSARTIV